MGPATSFGSLVVILLLGFAFLAALAILGGFAVAAFRTFRRRGESDGGCLPGCLLAGVLGFLVLLAVAALVVFVVLGGMTMASNVASGPLGRLERIEVERAPSGSWGDGWDETGRWQDGTEDVRLSFSVRGELGPELEAMVKELVAESSPHHGHESPPTLSITRSRDDHGHELSVYTFRLELERRELQRLERDLRRELGSRFRLPVGLEIEFEDENPLY